VIEPVFLSLSEVIEIHSDQILRYGGHVGVRDFDLLKSAVAMPTITFAGDYLHFGIHEMAAAYLFHIVLNHPFIDGNKRAGLVTALIFLKLNGVELIAETRELENLVNSVAAGITDKSEIALFFRRNSSTKQ
jgi:death on curing protein